MILQQLYLRRPGEVLHFIGTSDSLLATSNTSVKIRPNEVAPRPAYAVELAFQSPSSARNNARFKSEGARVQASSCLFEACCLDAKLTVYEDCDGDDYRRRIRDHYLSSVPSGRDRTVVRTQTRRGSCPVRPGLRLGATS
jgi:hypothetical protein